MRIPEPSYFRKRLTPALLLTVGAGIIATVLVNAWRPNGVNALTDDYSFVEFKKLADNGGRVDWSHDGQWIYYDRMEPDGFWDIHKIHPDGTGGECLTCDHPQLPNGNQGQPEIQIDDIWSSKLRRPSIPKQAYMPNPALASSMTCGCWTCKPTRLIN